MAKFRIENGVLIGENEELYLAQGAHRPLAFLLGQEPFPEQSIRTFARNLLGTTRKRPAGSPPAQ